MSKAKKPKPPKETVDEADARRVVEARAAVARGVSFWLECIYCEEGADVPTIDAAVAAGWKELHFDNRGLSWNFLGHCPVCQQEEEPTLRYLKTAATEAPKPGELFP